MENRAALEAMEREVKALFVATEQRCVRVIVPVPVANNLLNEQHPLTKWGPQIDPNIRERLAAAARGQGATVFVQAPRAATQASTQSPMQSPTHPTVPQVDTERLPFPPQTPTMNVEFLGLALDDDGHVLLPLHIDTAHTKGPLQVAASDQTQTMATVVASDRLTALTVVKLNRPSAKPIEFSSSKPPVGALTLLMSPTSRTAKLIVWSGRPDENGVMVDARGKVAAIIRNKHAIFPVTFMPVVQQLVAGRPVKRAQLGVMFLGIPQDHALRAQVPALGMRPAALVREVFANTAAAKAGVQAGDIILRINEEPVEDVATFAAAIANCRGTTQLHILRNGTPTTVAVELQAQ